MPTASRSADGMIAKQERRAIMERTQAALAAARPRGINLGDRVENLNNAELGAPAGG